MNRLKVMKQRFEAALVPLSLDITDDSHLHVGHVGADGGAGHFSVRIISDKFSGLNRVKRHQLVYSVVKDMMPNEIHALSIEALIPNEVHS